MKTHDKIPFRLVNGIRVKLNVRSFSRGGTLSPILYIIEYDGKWLAPTQYRKLGIEWIGFETMLALYLPNDLILKELMRSDALLFNIQKDDSWQGGTYILPI